MVPNEKNELVPMRLVTGWRVYAWTKKYHLLTPFKDQILDRLAVKGW